MGPGSESCRVPCLFTALFIIVAGAENAGSRLEGVRMCNAAQNKRDANDAHPAEARVFSAYNREQAKLELHACAQSTINRSTGPACPYLRAVQGKTAAPAKDVPGIFIPKAENALNGTK